jgi:serine/threonine-protein kinase
MAEIPDYEIPAQEVADRAYNLGLLHERQLQLVWAELGSRTVTADDFLQLCVRRELLTNYQVERLIRDEKTGFFFGDYKVLYFMGAGSFARVYRAVHKDSDQVVALKVLRKRFSDSPSQYGQFIREGELGRALRHKNIVPIYEVFSRAKIHFLVMEFVEGRNLRDFVKVRKKVEPEEATRLVIEIAEGLDYAFVERGLTHRDLKMTNVLVSSNGQAKLVDFGLAAIEKGLSNDAWVQMPNARTIDYAALERATGVHKDDTRSDIYFLGCIYYHMLTGKAPLSETRDRARRLSRQRLEEVVPVQQVDPSVPNSVAVVVRNAMDLDPDRRYQAPKQMLAGLQEASRRLREGTADEVVLEPQAEPSAAVQPTTVKEQHSIMVVESNAQLQDVFRDGLRKAGYRVLLTSDPQRALERFLDDSRTAECVLFDAQATGKVALEAFNQLGDEARTNHVPALLLLGKPQQKWRQHAKTAKHRVVMSMPIKMKELRSALAQLIPTETGSG